MFLPITLHVKEGLEVLQLGVQRFVVVFGRETTITAHYAVGPEHALLLRPTAAGVVVTCEPRIIVPPHTAAYSEGDAVR